MSDSTLIQLRRIMVRLGDLPHERAEIRGGLTNGELLSRLREITPESAESEEYADDCIEENSDSAEVEG